ncbi:AIR carboxylase family protein [bacterium]|jgi:5-(carboxyamino)imidazole ribonucleotide mutase|nr:AIR carboxylase family protein [bacterium]MBT4122226.1 AIR carboxylase family protein [bacterium]MBT4335429.1 AIR carboxylase family protein [bacterium]MBT4495758.1 AIR carboxylase family protein [bacterium]MBT4763956.1 AIR carboxylase family protein [bacterium]
MKVIIIMGSSSDKEWATKIEDNLKTWDLEFEEHILSAHKVPEMVFDLVTKLNQEKDIVYITIAGRSNGLSGVTAANSIHPVIACPPFSSKEDMMVNIHSTLQMPSATPVLTVLDPKNVADACARILGLSNDDMQSKVVDKIKDIKKSF